MKRYIYYYFFHAFCIIILSHLQLKASAADSSRLRVSLLTCTPGNELYSIFGHSALRIIDSSSITDLVYNYGTFNFDDEGFYIKFIRGKLMYYLSIEEFNDFKFSYQATNRGMTEQVLNFSAEEKLMIQHAINENLRNENKFYKYDFFLDNCTTRLRDLIAAKKDPRPLLPAVMPIETTFRHAIHEYLNKGKKNWSKLGIDILLGAPTDAVMTTAQQQFLPDNLMKALDQTRNVNIVNSSNQLYSLAPEDHDHTPFTPMVLFSLLLALFIFLSFFKNTQVQLILAGLDGLLFFLTGLLGILLIFMMTGTDHSMTKNNYNILWALPTHFVIAFFINKRSGFIKKYFLFSSIAMALVLLGWFFLPQLMNNALLPLVLLLLYRSALKYLKGV